MPLLMLLAVSLVLALVAVIVLEAVGVGYWSGFNADTIFINESARTFLKSSAWVCNICLLSVAIWDYIACIRSVMASNSAALFSCFAKSDYTFI
ncbi:hypothetical protein EDC94DRAFT_623481 [Helicostylum pulchrum]|nr:hypothetical protein EDC94DRAFT_623481 [Helicostylum pulchrum]